MFVKYKPFFCFLFLSSSTDRSFNFFPRFFHDPKWSSVTVKHWKVRSRSKSSKTLFQSECKPPVGIDTYFSFLISTLNIIWIFWMHVSRAVYIYSTSNYHEWIRPIVRCQLLNQAYYSTHCFCVTVHAVHTLFMFYILNYLFMLCKKTLRSLSFLLPSQGIFCGTSVPHVARLQVECAPRIIAIFQCRLHVTTTEYLHPSKFLTSEQWKSRNNRSCNQIHINNTVYKFCCCLLVMASTANQQ